MDDEDAKQSLTLGVLNRSGRTSLALLDGAGNLLPGQMDGDLVVKSARGGYLRVTQTFVVKHDDAFPIVGGNG